MVTREQLYLALGDNKKAFTTKNVDHDCLAISLLREKIPYEDCRSIISGAEHDVLFLCDVEQVLEHLSEDDLAVLADCNMCIDKEYDCLFLFV